MNEALNSPIAVVAILGIALGGVAALIREVSFAFSRFMGKSALDTNAAVMNQIVTELKTHGVVMSKLLDEQKEIKNMVHDLAFEKRS